MVLLNPFHQKEENVLFGLVLITLLRISHVCVRSFFSEDLFRSRGVPIIPTKLLLSSSISPRGLWVLTRFSDRDTYPLLSFRLFSFEYLLRTSSLSRLFLGLNSFVFTNFPCQLI